VISARPYNETKGGHVVLHKLCDVLLGQGIDACLRPDQPSRTFSVCSRYRSAITHHVTDDDLVIYHNSIHGNPWGAKHIVRWMLYPGQAEPGIRLDYSPQFGPGPYLTVVDARLDLFFDAGLPRTGTCWTRRKADRQKVVVPEQSGTEIPRGASLEALACLFNRHERFICYDGASFLAVQAALCGCDVLVPHPIGQFPYPGIATCESGLPRAREERSALRALLEQREHTQAEQAAETIRWAMNQRST
jgi:hypothetical protein